MSPLLLLLVLAASGSLMAADEVFGIVKPFWLIAVEMPEGVRPASFYTSADYRGPTELASKVPGAVSLESPAVAWLGDTLFAAGRGPGDVLWSSTVRGNSWTDVRPTGHRSKAGAALAPSSGALYMAWVSEDVGGAVAWVSTRDGTWSEAKRLAESHTDVTPALADCGRYVCAAWKVLSPGTGVAWSAFDGTEWAKPQPIEGASTDDPPALAGVDGYLYLVWRGVGPSASTLWWSRFDGTAWSAPAAVPGAQTTSPPAAAVYRHSLAVAWRSAGLVSEARWSAFDEKWSAPASTGLSTCGAPALSSHPLGLLTLAGRGSEADRCDDPSDLGGSWDTSTVYTATIGYSPPRSP
jgi:hypothetical protein